MSLQLIREFVIPKCSAKAFALERGQVLRVIAHEGKQVADLKFFNRHDLKEQFAASWSILLNTIAGTGTSQRITKLWSRPPYENVMLTVVEDAVGQHLMNGSCSQRWAELSGGMAAVVQGDKTCWDLFHDVLGPYGIGAADTDSQGTFNVFMSVRYDDAGMMIFESPRCEAGDHIDFRAEMDVLVAATSCPDTNEINDFVPKGMKYQVFAAHGRSTG